MARDLPWAGASPWGVLVSEVMLQQTPVSRVRRYWGPFTTRFPAPVDLAGASVAEVLGLWRGLGYPRRALRLIESARAIVEIHDGEVPSTPEDLLRLPGVGAYTSSAVASFAFGRSVPVIDTNVGRVLARALAGRSLSARDARALAERLLPERGVAPFNQSLLDLGAQWCRPQPHCQSCPVRRVCAWRGVGGDDPARGSAYVSRAQAPYAGSERERRGLVLRHLGTGATALSTLESRTGLTRGDLERVVDSLVTEGFCGRAGEKVTWAS